jgi:hypothetical protein
MYKSRSVFLNESNPDGWKLKELLNDVFVKQNCPKNSTKHEIFNILNEKGKIQSSTTDSDIEELPSLPESLPISETIYLQCVSHNNQLKTTVYNHSFYHPTINCQLPKKMIVEGRLLKVTDLKIAKGPNNKLFYRVNPKDIEIVDKIDISQVDKPKKCVSCDNNKDIIFMPCGHYTSCSECYKTLSSTCMICKRKITDILQISDSMYDE